MTQSLYRIHGTWAQAYADLRANGLPDLEEGMTWLDLDIDGTVRRITKARHINEAIARGSFVRVDIWQFDLVASLDDADPDATPEPKPATPVARGPHLNLNFSNEDYRVDVVNAAWLAEPAQNHDTPGAMIASWALQNRGGGKPEIATVHRKGSVALIASPILRPGGPRFVFSGG